MLRPLGSRRYRRVGTRSKRASQGNFADDVERCGWPELCAAAGISAALISERNSEAFDDAVVECNIGGVACVIGAEPRV